MSWVFVNLSFSGLASKSKTSFFFFIGRECLFITRHKSCHKLKRNTFYDFYLKKIVFVKRQNCHETLLKCVLFHKEALVGDFLSGYSLFASFNIPLFIFVYHASLDEARDVYTNVSIYVPDEA